MVRNPSIHLTKDKLVLVLKKCLDKKQLGKTSFEELASAILVQGKIYALTNRQLVVDKAKLLKSTSKVVLSTREDAGSFANLLMLIRRQRKHRGINMIKVGTNEWNMIKEVAALATNFCNDFQLNREEGYKIYINSALDKMGNFSLSKFNNLHQSICDDYQAVDEIKKDMTPKLTEAIREAYERNLGERFAIVEDYRSKPFKYVFFVRAKEEALRLGIPGNIYIKAQFKGLEWCNSYPEPNQLVGSGALTRLNKYIVEEGIKPESMDKEKKAIEVGNKLKSILSTNDND